jgi:hypothetical protein
MAARWYFATEWRGYATSAAHGPSPRSDSKLRGSLELGGPEPSARGTRSEGVRPTKSPKSTLGSPVTYAKPILFQHRPGPSFHTLCHYSVEHLCLAPSGERDSNPPEASSGVLAQCAKISPSWRREWDSNPRGCNPYTISRSRTEERLTSFPASP